MKYKIGEILTSTAEVEVERVLSGKVEKLPKGSQVIIGADNLAHHIGKGIIQTLPINAKVEGYDTAGIAEYVYRQLRAELPMSEMQEEFGISDDEVKSEIEYALDEMGF